MSVRFQLLPESIRQDSRIGAEVVLPKHMPILDLALLSEDDRSQLRQALFQNQVVVIRNQQGIDASVLPQLAKVFDPHASDIHSAGEKAVSDPRNILSAYKAGRIPDAPQVWSRLHVSRTKNSADRSALGWHNRFRNFQGLPRNKGA